MNTMSFLVWIFPIVYILHDFEEILMAEVWGTRYKKELALCFPKNQPFGLNFVHSYQTPSFASGVCIFFTLYTIISFFSVIVENYVIWISLFIPIILHFVIIHVSLCFRFKHYVPGVITSVVFVFPCILCLIKVQQLLDYSLLTWILASAIGSFASLLIMKFLHRFMGTIATWFQKYSIKKPLFK